MDHFIQHRLGLDQGFLSALSSSSIDQWKGNRMVRFIVLVLLDGIYDCINRHHGYACCEVKSMNDEHEFHKVTTYSI